MLKALFLAFAALLPAPALAEAPIQPAVIADPPANAQPTPDMVVVRVPSHGALINGVLYRAAGVDARPTMLLLHGFPGNEQNLDLAQTVRRAGWDVLTLHYRGSWGSPGAFSFAHAGEDTKAALAWLRDPANAVANRIDPGKIVIAGHSMGGFVGAKAAADPAVIGTVLIDAWDIGATAEELKTSDGRAAWAAELAEDLPALVGTSARALTREIEHCAPACDLKAAMPPLANRPMLILGAERGDAATARVLADAAKAAGATQTELQIMTTDHAFSTKRIALANSVVTWLKALVWPAVAFDGRYDDDNAFARIIRGETPVVKVYEDADVLAFMDQYPRAPGHVLVISKTEKARNILEMSDAMLGKLMAVARKVAAAQRVALGADGVVVQQNSGVAQSVPHLHIHVMPVKRGVALTSPEVTPSTRAELEAIAAKLRAAMRSGSVQPSAPVVRK